MKNGRTWKRDISIIKRGIKEFNYILPEQLKHVFIRSILIAVIPFITTAVSVYMINNLLESKSNNSLIITCLIGLGLLFFLNIWQAFKDKKIAVGFEQLFSSHEIALTNKSYYILYEELEKSNTKKLRDKVAGSINLSGAGMASLYWDMEVIFTNAIIIISAFFITGYYIYKISVWDYSVNHTLLHAIEFFLCIFILVIVCSYIICKISNKRFDITFDVFEHGSEYSRYGEFYTMEYLSDESAAIDIRLYKQGELILSECQEKCYERFAVGKEKEIGAINSCDGIKLLCSCISGCIIYILVGQKAMQGVIGCGSILMMYSAVTMVIQACSDIAQIITDLRNNNEHLIRFFQYMDLPEVEPEEKEEKSTKLLLSELKEIEFQNVSFCYPDSKEYVLKNINFKIQIGDKIALVGENGSGKTTLIKLLCRFYKPTEGVILLNGIDIWEYPYSKYIHCISTVFQDFSLFAFLLAENVAASLNYEEYKVKEALEKAGFIKKLEQFEKGILQPIFHDFDEEGVNLSGGEEQKIAIARAVYKDSDLMILDEPTASLDPYAEYEIYKNFQDITREKTLISISHRLSSCRMCDRIIVIKHGEILQVGSHKDLLNDLYGEYYKLWNAQAQYYQ